jgi:pyridoxine 4-dehydrogenase
LENLFSCSDVGRKKNQQSGSREGRNTMTKQTTLGGIFTLPGTPIKLVRMGYGAMQLAGPEIWGPPRDVDAAIAVLREAIASGVNHIDTSDYYGPHVTNQIIKKALHPYPDDLVIVTKLGARRGGESGRPHGRRGPSIRLKSIVSH